MTRPARALLSARALRHNFARVRAYAPASKIMAVIKANGYGHGLAWAARVLHDADGYAVASVEEALAARAVDADKHICLLEGFYDAGELPLIAKHRFSPVIHHAGQVAALAEGKGLDGLEAWLKIDTGMHRLGFPPEQAASAAVQLAAVKSIRKLRWMTHFANADNRFDSATDLQIKRFDNIVEGVEVERSLANSAGIVAWPASHREWVRPGIMLYGGSPLVGHAAADFDLQPVMTLESRLIAVNRRKNGEAVGYGGDWICPEDMPVGVVAIGYGDGYPRHAPSGTPVLINGARAPLIGRVSMDMISVDLRAVPGAHVGDRAVLWGEGLPVDEIAGLAGTISYELLCCVTPRVPRIEAGA